MTRHAIIVVSLILAGSLCYAINLPEPEDMVFEPITFNTVEPAQKTLNNGLEIWFLEDHSLPLITIFANIGVGSQSEPDDRFGLAEMTAEMLFRGGTASKSPDEVDAYIDQYALKFQTRSGSNLTSLEMSCLAKDFETVLPFFVEILQHPRFDVSRMDLIRDTITAEIRRRHDSPFYEAFNNFSKLVYGKNHPNARVPSEEALAAISPEDLMMFHKTYFCPDIVKIGISGDFEIKAMSKHLKRTFSGWKGKSADKISVFPPATEAEGKHVYIVPKESTQAAFVMGHLGVAPNSPDMYSVELFSKILGFGGFSSRLMNQVRTQNGLAYTVFGGFMENLPVGQFGIGCMTKISTASDAVQLSLDIVDDLRSNPVSDEELNRFRKNIENAFIFKFENPKYVLKEILYNQRMGLPADYLVNYLDNMQAVTPASIQAAANKHVRPDDIFIVAVGPEAELREEFADLSWPIEVLDSEK